MAPEKADPWHARAPMWIALALTAVTGFGVQQGRLAAAEARHEAGTRDISDIRSRITALEARCNDRR